jgi:hypothetical protein
VAEWVRASVESQSLPLRVTDPSVLRRVCALVGAAAPVNDGRDERGAASAARTPLDLPSRLRGPRSKKPVRSDAVVIDRLSTGLARPDDGVVEDCGDDGGLSGEVEAVPRSA